MVYGWADPLGYLAADDGVPRITADKILEAAQEIKHHEDRQFWRNMEVAVQNGVAKAFE